MFINIHTHSQIFDAHLELVNLFLERNDRVKYYSYGLHPWHIDGNYKDDLEHLGEIAHEKGCLAIGECGLDKVSKVDFELQEKVFVEHIKIANKLKKPLIIHCVKAFNELINCLNHNNNQVPVIIHGFNNNDNIARLLNAEGYYFSFGKDLLGFESNAAKAIKTIGRKRFFLETDDKDLSIKYVYLKAGELLGVNGEIVQLQIEENFKTVFNFTPKMANQK
ncbi:MAG: TatD family hydrolase [Bacteroidota bacterium]|nr:TatD family hydrolase [Bacteroidota bacterium]